MIDESRERGVRRAARDAYRHCTGEGASKRNTSSMAAGISERSLTISWRWAGCSARGWAVKPIGRAAVSFPAPAIMVVYPSTSVRVRRRRWPFSSISACSSCVIKSSDGLSARQSMYSANSWMPSWNELASNS
jgi:hypothetical protein